MYAIYTSSHVSTLFINKALEKETNRDENSHAKQNRIEKETMDSCFSHLGLLHRFSDRKAANMSAFRRGVSVGVG